MSLFLTKTKKPILFTQDIIEECSKRTGKSVELINEVYKINLEYIKKEIKENKEIVLVSFPNLGKLRFNYYLGLCSKVVNKSPDTKKRIEERLDFIRVLLKKEKGGELKNFNRPAVFNLFSGISDTFPGNIMKDFYKNWKAIEERHNDNHSEYFK